MIQLREICTQNHRGKKGTVEAKIRLGCIMGLQLGNDTLDNNELANVLMNMSSILGEVSCS